MKNTLLKSWEKFLEPITVRKTADLSNSAPTAGSVCETNIYFFEHSDRDGVALQFFDREYNFGKQAARRMLKELSGIVEKWGDSK